MPLTRAEWAILSLTIGTVCAAESANTAIEFVVDLVSPEYHDLARRSKDAAAGAVLIMALTALVIGGLILGPPLLVVLGRFMLV
ncbi:MAG: diacylglycerol kinase family protein [Planctomycetia bacterium]|nr:diacylglycerol kinase family protein [Planctomycetia bacterium]